MGPIFLSVILAAQAAAQVQPAVPVPPGAPLVPVIDPPVVPAAAPTGPRNAAPRGNPGNWATANDYPARALRDEQEGRTQFRLIVGADGRAYHCEIRASSGSRALDQVTCAIIKRRARFHPALSETGAPIEGAWSSSVRWQIPARQPPRLSSLATVQRFVVTAEGGLAKCGKGVPEYPPVGADIACDPTIAYLPVRDASGQAADRQVTITTTRRIENAD